MSNKPPIIFPWQRQGAYLASELYGRGLLSGYWSKSVQDLDNDGTPELTITRTRDAHGRIAKIEIVDTRDAKQNKTIMLSYDDLGRVVIYDFQEKLRPHTTTYKYDLHDHLEIETAVTTNLDGVRHTTIATHTFDSHGVLSTTSVTSDTKKYEERYYTPFGAIELMRVFDNAGNVTQENQAIFDSYHREIKKVSRAFIVDLASGKSRLYFETVEENSYFKDTDKLAQTHLLETNEFEKSPGVFLMGKYKEDMRIFAPPTGGVEHFESRAFLPGPDDQPVETGLLIEDTTIDEKGRPIESKIMVTDRNTGEKKTTRTITTYRNITVTTKDIDADGTDAEELVIISDEAGRMIEMRNGKPNFGPFIKLERRTYDDHGELVKRVEFENNLDKPSIVETFS